MATAPKRSHRAKPLADFVENCLGPALAKQGFSGSDIIASWPDILGERLAAASEPMRIEWSRRSPGASGGQRDPATLVVRVEGAFAIELQHLAPIVLERVNAYYGWKCVGRLVLKQRPVRREARRAPATRALGPDETGQLAARLAGIEQDPLRDALDRLGHAVLAERPTPSLGQTGPAVPQSS